MKTVNIRLHELPLYIVAIMFFLMLLSGILVPIYSDEMAIHLSRARYLFDGFKITGLFPQCGSSWLRSPLLSEYPAVILNFIFRPSVDPFYLRASGLAFAFAWFSLLWFFLGRVIEDRTVKFFLWILLISICAIGPLPYVMVLARSEQMMLLLLTFVCVLPLVFPMTSNDKAHKLLVKFILFFCVLSALYFAHPKAIFFAPFVFVALYFFSLNVNIVLRVICMLLALGVTYQAVAVALTVTGCAEAPGVVKVLSNKTLDPTGWHKDPIGLIEQMLINIAAAVDQNIFRLAFSDEYQSSWILSAEIVKSSPLINYLNEINRVALYFLYYFGAALIVVTAVWKISLDGDIRRHLLAVSLLGGLVLNAAVYNKIAWNFYTPGLMVPLFAFAVLLVAPDFLNLFRQRIYLLYVLVLPWCLLACLNLIVLGATVTPGLIRTAQEGELTIKDQLISAPVFLSQRSRETLDYLVQECKLPHDGAVRLAVDLPSYSYMKSMRQPISVLYVSIAYGMDIPDLGKFLHNIQSDGILSRCDYLPMVIRNRAVNMNNMCCLSREALLK